MAKIKFRQGASFEEYCPFPVGTCLFCLYDPNAVWPGTTWHRHGEGHYLVSAGDTYKVNNTYGSNTHVLTIEEIPSHSHTGDGGNNWNVELSKGGNTGRYAAVSGNNWIDSSSVHTGGGQPHNNMPYSVCVPLWRRTA